MFKFVRTHSQPIGDHPLWPCPLRVVSILSATFIIDIIYISCFIHIISYKYYIFLILSATIIRYTYFSAEIGSCTVMPPLNWSVALCHGIGLWYVKAVEIHHFQLSCRALTIPCLLIKFPIFVKHLLFRIHVFPI